MADSVKSPESLQLAINYIESRLEMRHPNIVPVYEAFQNISDDLCFTRPVSLEGNLRSEIVWKQRLKINFTEAELFEILRDVSSGLQYVHWQGHHHGDLKPDNIQKQSPDQWLLFDFGAPKTIGVNPYNSPEAFAGEIQRDENGWTLKDMDGNRIFKEIDTQKSDCWSFGFMALELYKLCKPFKFETIQEYRKFFLNFNPPMEGVPEWIAQLC
jgi:serine/threonine protein kinase